MARIDRNPGPGSPRYGFQWKYLLSAETLPALNVGCANDPLRFGEYAVHFDYDDWSQLYRPGAGLGEFVQGDGHRLPFADSSFFLVLCGDVLEHAVYPDQMFLECCRVAKRWAVFTIFEEWRLPTTGQHIAFGTTHRDEEAQRHGYTNAAEHFAAAHPQWRNRGGISHHPHINRFSDADVLQLAVSATERFRMRVREYLRADEAVYDDHVWSNWLICMEREHARQTS